MKTLEKLINSPKPVGRPKKEKKERGRPRKDVDWQLVYQLATYQCTRNEIYAALRVTQPFMIQYKEKFEEIYQRGLEDGKVRFRKAQTRMADKNPVMAIWCGKQYLGQSDNPQATQTIDGTIKVVFEDASKDKERLEKMEANLKDELK